jgi:hypothetical protein
VSLTVCHEQPRSPATSDTERLHGPTQRAALSVSAWRGKPLQVSSQLQLMISHCRLRQMKRDLAPAQPARSSCVRKIDQLDRLSILDLRELAAAQTQRARTSLLNLHNQGDHQQCRRCPARSPRASPPAARTCAYGRPPTGAPPGSDGVENLPILGAPVPRPVPGQPEPRP